MKSALVLARPILAIAALLAGSVFVHAQDLPAKHMLFTESAGYVAGLPAVISGADASLSPDPRGRYALILHVDAAPRQDTLVTTPTDAPTDAPFSNLLLYDGHTGRTRVVWRSDTGGKASGVSNQVWLEGVDAALCVVYEAPSTAQTSAAGSPAIYSLLYIRPTSTGLISRVIYTDTGLLSIRASPTLPIAVITNAQPSTDRDGHVSFAYKRFTVDERGTIGAPLALGPEAAGGYTWSADGTTTYYRDLIAEPPTATGGATSAPPKPAASPKKQWYSFNVQTSVLTPIADQPPFAARAKPEDKNVLRLVSGALTASPPGSGDAQPTAKVSRFAPLWLVRSDQKHEGHLPTATLITPDAQRSVLLADDSAVLYVAQRSVFAVPLTRQRRPDLDAAYRQQLKQETMSQAKQLGLALIGYTQDNEEKLPDAGNLAQTLAPYVGNSSLFNNPETDQPGFTLSLPGQKYSDIADAAHTVLGYLAGPGGRAALMADGHVKWEDSP